MHRITLFVKTNEAIYFDSFGIEHIPNEINKFIGSKNIKSNIFRLQAMNQLCVDIIV